MQWNWLSTTKLALAGLLLVLVAGDSLARPGDRLFGRWRNQSEPTYNNQYQQYQQYNQYQPVQQTQPVVQQPVVQQPVAQQPVVQQPVVQQPVVQQQTVPQYTTTRRGLFGRRTQQVVQTPVQQAAPATGTTTTNDNRQSFYPAPAGTQSFIEVRLPVADAQVNFNGTATTQSGNNRLFVTPALEAQRDNVYQVTARWTVNGSPVEQQREIKVAPGSRVVVDFTQAQAQQPQGQQPPAVIQPGEQPAPAPQQP